MAKRKTAKFDCVKKMPPLRHSIPGKPFSWPDSEVARWLMSQPDILDSGTWRGCDYGR